MSLIFLTLLAGFLGTSAMIIFMSAITRLKWANANMLMAIGSIITHSKKDAFLTGYIVHNLVGCTLAFFHILFLSILPTSDLALNALFGLFSGFGHGFIVSFLLVVSVAEHHPLEEYRETGMQVAVSHVFGHVVYGTMIGIVVGLLKIKYTFFDPLTM